MIPLAYTIAEWKCAVSTWTTVVRIFDEYCRCNAKRELIHLLVRLTMKTLYHLEVSKRPSVMVFCIINFLKAIRHFNIAQMLQCDVFFLFLLTMERMSFELEFMSFKIKNLKR